MLKNINQRHITLALFVVSVVIGVVLWHGNVNKDNDYSVIYLTTGEVYVGKLRTFPDLELKDGYILQVTKDATDSTKNNFQLQPINEALWAPKVLHINKENVVFYGPLRSTSKIAETLATQAK